MHNLSPTPAVSVVIPAYNCGRYIPDALESILRQTISGFEIIVIDDGSTDGTEQAVASFRGENRIRYYRQSNLGPGAARNRGIAQARADIIAFLDADDILEPESLQRRLDVLSRYPEISFVFSDTYVRLSAGNPARIFFRERKFLEKSQSAIECADNDVYIFKRDIVRFCLRENLFPWTGTVMLRKSAVTETGGFSTERFGGEDKLMWLAILKRCRAAFIAAPLAVYNKYRSSLTRDYERYCLDSIHILAVFLEREFGDYPEESRIIRNKIGDRYFELAYHYLHKEGGLRQARKYFRESMRYNMRDGKNYFYLPLSWLPMPFFKIISRLKRCFP